ncbi:MAG: hypothetical protein HS115_10140 [Spirochaetales bacterium]|nr:hypothetical protein [Spirochaetales bacterium]
MTLFRLQRLSPISICAGAAAALSLLAGLYAAQTNNKFLVNHSFSGDTRAYTAILFRVGLLSDEIGPWRAIQSELQNNNRNPLRTIPVLATYPAALKTYNAHLLTAVPALSLFVFLLSYVAWKRTGSWGYVACTMILPFTGQALMDPARGLPANLPDITAGHLVAGAFLALLLANGPQNKFWLIIFGVLIGLAILSRWSIVVQIGFVFLPLVAWRVLGNTAEGTRRISESIQRIAYAGIPILLIAGYFLNRFSVANYHFYAANAYGIGHTSEMSRQFLLHYTDVYLGATGLLCISMYIIIPTFLGLRPKKTIREHLAALSGPCLFYIFFVYVLRLYGDPSTPAIFPSLIYAFVAGIPRETQKLRQGFSVLIILTFLSILYAGLRGHREVSQRIQNPGSADLREANFEKTAARTLASIHDTGSAPKIDTFFFPYCTAIFLRSVAEHDFPIVCTGFFEKHDVAYQYHFKTTDPGRIAARILPEISKKLNAVFIIQDPSNEDAKILFTNDNGSMNKIPAVLIGKTREYLFRSTHWKRHPVLLDSPWGKIELFLNVKILSATMDSDRGATEP